MFNQLLTNIELTKGGEWRMAGSGVNAGRTWGSRVATPDGEVNVTENVNATVVEPNIPVIPSVPDILDDLDDSDEQEGGRLFVEPVTSTGASPRSFRHDEEDK